MPSPELLPRYPVVRMYAESEVNGGLQTYGNMMVSDQKLSPVKFGSVRRFHSCCENYEYSLLTPWRIKVGVKDEYLPRCGQISPCIQAAIQLDFLRVRDLLELLVLRHFAGKDLVAV